MKLLRNKRGHLHKTNFQAGLMRPNMKSLRNTTTFPHPTHNTQKSTPQHSTTQPILLKKSTRQPILLEKSVIQSIYYIIYSIFTYGIYFYLIIFRNFTYGISFDSRCHHQGKTGHCWSRRIAISHYVFSSS